MNDLILDFRFLTCPELVEWILDLGSEVAHRSEPLQPTAKALPVHRECTFPKKQRARHGACLSDLFSIPTGLHLKAQGCAARATLGRQTQNVTTPKGLRPGDIERWRSGRNPRAWSFVANDQRAEGPRYKSKI
jgi:hypothetical protein